MSNINTPAAQRLRILVVEDEVIVARDIQLQLSDLGYLPVGHCTDGEDAVARAAELRPDLILMDIQLAGPMNGIEAARRIRAKSALPVVFLTAFASEDTIGQAKQAEPFGYLLKPFSERELSTVIEIAVHKHRAEILLQERTSALLEINTELANQKFALDQHAIVAVMDLKGTITYANDKLCSISGYSRAELLGKLHRIVDSGIYPESFFWNVRQVLLSGKVWRGELCNRGKSGGFYWVDSTIVPLLKPSGEPHSYVTIQTDITERKQAEEARRLSEERFQAIFEYAEVGMFETTPEGRVTRANRCLSKLLRQPVETFAGRSWQEFLHPEAREGSMSGPPLDPQKMQFMCADGHVFWGELTCSIEVNDVGTAIGNICILSDITAQVKARESLVRFNSELEEKVSLRTNELGAKNREIQALLHAIPDMVMRLRADGKVLHLQHAKEGNGLGAIVDADEEVRTGVTEVLHAASLSLGRKALAENVAGTKEIELEVDGNLLALELRATPLGGDEFVAFVRDITERKSHEIEVAAMLEKERQISEMKTRFIAVTSHEFRTPMTALMGAVEILSNHLDRLSPEKRGELFGRINSSLDRMTEMLDAVLTLNRMDVNEVEVRAEPVDPKKIVDNAAEEILVGDRSAHVIEVRSSGESESIVTDPQLLHHIVSNLLSNAVRYSPVGSVVSVQIGFGNNNVSISVKDRGIGIPAADLTRIFDPFERGSNTGTIKGTGLGLNIVKRMTETLGGKISVSSAEGEGTQFTVIFPRSLLVSTAE